MSILGQAAHYHTHQYLRTHDRAHLHRAAQLIAADQANPERPTRDHHAAEAERLAHLAATQHGPERDATLALQHAHARLAAA